MKATGTLIIAILLGFSATAFAQFTVHARASVTLIQAIGIQKNNDLNFSTMLTNTANGSVVLDAGNILPSPGIGPAENGNSTLAAFTVSGAEKSTFSITLPTTAFTIAENDTNAMVVSDFTSTPLSNNLLLANNRVIRVGGTLHLPQNQETGTYSSQNPFPVTLNYN